MLHRNTSSPAGAIVAVVLLTLMSGCDVNSPEMPSFDTTFVLPLGSERLEIIDAVDDEDYLVINGDGSLGFLIEGEADSLSFGVDLSTNIPTQDFSQGLGDFNLTDPAPLAYDFELADMWAPANGVVGLLTKIGRASCRERV